jgi:RNA recognition motif-containing protein
MSTHEKRAREDKRNEKAREKERKRRDKRFTTSSGPELTTVDEIVGNMRSIEEVMHSLQAGNQVQRSAAPIPAKLFVGSLSDSTKSSSLRAHFEPHGAIVEAVVITDRDTGATRNFGFVTMADRKEAAGAIDALHHSELDGSRIVVNVATERPGGSGR